MPLMRLRRRRPDPSFLEHVALADSDGSPRRQGLRTPESGILHMLDDPSAVRVGAFDADASGKAERGDVSGDSKTDAGC
ncbi:hypothetical protein CHR55_32650 [Rhodococcus qingshengii]|uniref:Uncharacterized protein n=1 Tax=Rhodococcus qingshengii TaxID=334542 RepID=A0A2A5IYU6_RHOSG|nr:hypothetical protein CHR55_32650 [Rhodococcus qingshengii]